MARDVPKPPPWLTSFPEILSRRVTANEAARVEIAEALGAADTAKGYLHWDSVRHRPVPSGWSHDEFWVLLRFDRWGASREFPRLRQVDGTPFRLTRSDPLLAALHRIDSLEVPWRALQDASGSHQDISYRLMAAIEEAHHSSAIEGAVTTRRQSRELIRSEREPRDRSERMVLNNYRTLEKLLAWSEQPLTPELLLAIQESITEGTLDDPRDVGRYRTDDDVRVIDSLTGESVYHPPTWTELEERMERLCAFANEDSSDELFVHPVVRAVLLHHQLAYDHPFGDGNGRTARTLFLWSVLRSGYSWFRSLSISRAVNKARTQYYRSFLHVQTDEGDVTYFVRQQIRCIEREIDTLSSFLARRAALERWLAERELISSSLNTRQLALTEHALNHPDAEYTALGHGRVHGVAKVTGRADLISMQKLGLLTSRKVGREHRFRAAKKLVALAAERPRELRRR